jgi:hypothetical protein
MKFSMRFIVTLILLIFTSSHQLYAMENNKSPSVPPENGDCYFVDYDNHENLVVSQETLTCILIWLELNDLFQCNKVCKTFNKRAYFLLNNASYPYELSNNHMTKLGTKAFLRSCVLQATHAARHAVVNANYSVQSRGFVLFESMVRKGQAVPEAIQAIQVGLKSLDAGVIMAVFYCLMTVADKGHAIDDVTNACQKVMTTKEYKYVQGYALEAIKNQAKRGNALNEAAQIAELGMATEDIVRQNDALEIFAILIERRSELDSGVDIISMAFKAAQKSISVTEVEQYRSIRLIGLEKRAKQLLASVNEILGK